MSFMDSYRRAPPNKPPPHQDEKLETHYTPMYVMTFTFAAIFFIGPCMIKKGENKWITRTCIMLTAFCLWLFWIIVHIATLNPLIAPHLRNTTLAWMAHLWGKSHSDKLSSSSSSDSSSSDG